MTVCVIKEANMASLVAFEPLIGCPGIHSLIPTFLSCLLFDGCRANRSDEVQRAQAKPGGKVVVRVKLTLFKFGTQALGACRLYQT